MQAPARTETEPTSPPFTPYVAEEARTPELTVPAVLVGAILGIVFGASSLYLVLKVGMTVSASIPVAVLSITLFRVLARVFGLRRATILENNIVQTTGSAGESIAFGVGVTMPALMLLGFDMDVVRVMTVGVLGGLLGILMMIPLRRAFIVQQHGKLTFPEGTACAEVLIVGEKGGATARTVFAGFGLAFLYKFCVKALHLWKEEVDLPLYDSSGRGLKGGVIGGELSPELLGVGYIIGPRTGSIMLAGGVLAYLVFVPTIVLFGGNQSEPLAPATTLIRDMNVAAIRSNYILYIGAGAVATGGILSMFQALPMILSSIRAGLTDLSREGAQGANRKRRTERDLPMIVVLVGSVLLVAALASVPKLGLGWTASGLLGSALVVVFGFLFVTVSSRLTGEIGSSSNPISGMTVATLLLTCLIFLATGRVGPAATLSALTIAAVVCVASSNGGTTAQDLKTGFLVGATPIHQQLAILVGALTSALVIGVTLLLLNEAGTVYTNRPEYIPDYRVPNVAALVERQRVGGEHGETDQTLYHVLHVSEGQLAGVPQGKYLVDDAGKIRYLVDPAINGRVMTETEKGTFVRLRDDGTRAPNSFDAPKTRLMALIIDGILNQKLPWEMVLIGALIAVTLELAGVASLPFAVGVYLPIQVSTPIFLGGMVRAFVDWRKRRAAADAEMSPGVLISSGYIAGGALAGVTVAFLEFAPPSVLRSLDLSGTLPPALLEADSIAVGAFVFLIVVLALVGLEWILRAPPAGPRRAPSADGNGKGQEPT